jgi:hypothetical protein
MLVLELMPVLLMFAELEGTLISTSQAQLPYISSQTHNFICCCCCCYLYRKDVRDMRMKKKTKK